MLGNVPSDWDVRPLNVLLIEHYPGDWGDESGPEMFNVLRSTNLTASGHLDLNDVAIRALKREVAEKLQLRQYDLLLERSGGGPGQPVGRVGFVEADLDRSAFSNFLHMLRPNRGAVNPRYLGWVLWRIHQTGRILRLEQQTTQLRNLHFRDYLQMPLPVPPPAEQAAIARILDAVDTAIERVQDAIDRARDLHRSLVHSLLSVGLDRGGRARDQSQHEFATYRHGRFPQAWRPSTVGAEFALQTGFTLNESRHPRYQVRRYLRVANVQRGRLDLQDIASLEAKDAEFERRRLDVGDLLVVEGHADRMQIGRCAAVSPEAVGLTFQNHLFRLRSRGKIMSEFAVLWLNSEFAQRYWNARCATSSGLNTINQRMLLRMFFPVPDEWEQLRIIDIVKSQRTYLDALIGKQQVLNDLKRVLMHDLLTGEVRTDQVKLDEVAA